MYPPGFQTWVDVTELGSILEGRFRPGHFRGVATIVLKLFTIVRPTRAYFGQKDAQQAEVIRRLIRDLALEVELRVLPTVRDADGLALSSRNALLSPRGAGARRSRSRARSRRAIATAALARLPHRTASRSTTSRSPTSIRPSSPAPSASAPPASSTTSSWKETPQ